MNQSAQEPISIQQLADYWKDIANRPYVPGRMLPVCIRDEQALSSAHLLRSALLNWLERCKKAEWCDPIIVSLGPPMVLSCHMDIVSNIPLLVVENDPPRNFNFRDALSDYDYLERVAHTVHTMGFTTYCAAIMDVAYWREFLEGESSWFKPGPSIRSLNWGGEDFLVGRALPFMNLDTCDISSLAKLISEVHFAHHPDMPQPVPLGSLVMLNTCETRRAGTARKYAENLGLNYYLGKAEYKPRGKGAPRTLSLWT